MQRAQKEYPAFPSATPESSAAIIEPGATIGAGVEIGPFSVIGPEVVLAANVRIHPHVVIAGKTEIGEGTQIFPFASLGQAPQDRKFRGEDSRLIIGSGNVIREYVTMNPGTEQGGLVTRIGNNGLFLTGAHVAHDCQIGNSVLLVTRAHRRPFRLEDFASVGGLSRRIRCPHRRLRLYRRQSGVENDVIPSHRAGHRAHLAGLNIVRPEAPNFDREQIPCGARLRMLFATEARCWSALDDVEKMFSEDPHVKRSCSSSRPSRAARFACPQWL